MADENPKFTLTTCFPDAAAVFSAAYHPIDDVKGECLVALDTNILLAPYDLGSNRFAEICATYAKLVDANRLIVPGQVAREFAANRSIKLGEIANSLLQAASGTGQPIPQSADFLQAVDGYKDAIELSKQIGETSQKLKAAIGKTVDAIRSWRFNDPITKQYQKLFSDCTVDFDVEAAGRAALSKEMIARYEQKIPPGYEDRKKDDGGVGDFLIWKTILQVGTEKKQHLVFVTAEKKKDWWTQASKEPLSPRFELIDEYRRASSGRSFHILTFSEFLGRFGAKAEVIKDVKHV
jgi:hypothetical protein